MTTLGGLPLNTDPKVLRKVEQHHMNSRWFNTGWHVQSPRMRPTNVSGDKAARPF